MEENKVYVIVAEVAIPDGGIDYFYVIGGYDNAKKYAKKLENEGFYIPLYVAPVDIDEDGCFHIRKDLGVNL